MFISPDHSNVNRHHNVMWLRFRQLIHAGCTFLVLVLSGCSSSGSGDNASGAESEGSSLAWRLVSVEVTPAENSGEISRFAIVYEAGLSVGEIVDVDKDGVVDERFLYFYDEDHLVRSELDSDLDGRPDSVRYFNYDAAGLLVNESIDDGNDNSIDRVIDYVIAEEADIVANFDDNNDGIVDAISRFKRDQSDRLSTVEIDDDADGIPDAIDTLTYASDGRVINLTRMSVASGQIVERWDFTYELGLCAEASSHQPRRYGCLEKSGSGL